MNEVLTRLYKSKKLPWIIIGYGIILRIVQYLHNRALFIDEARDTVVGILGRSFTDLFGPPPEIFIPSPPLGFFVIEKLLVQFMGNTEYVLRFYPLVTGIASLFLFYYVARKCIDSEAVPVALALFATLEPLIYYSSSVRPYSSDVFFALLFILLLINMHDKKMNFNHTLIIGITGAVMIWFSSPSIFILAGAGISMALFALLQKDWKRLGWLAGVSVCWIASFIACYTIYLSNLTTGQYTEWIVNTMKGENAYIPLPPSSFSDISFYINTFFITFEDAGFYYVPGIAVLTFIVGLISLFRNKRDYFIYLIMPTLLVLLASGLTLYPFKHRMILFLLPSFLIFIAAGVDYINRQTRHMAPLIGTTIMVLLMFHPVLSATTHLFKPVTREEMKSVLRYVKQHWQEGDLIYLHYRAHPAFLYYAGQNGFDESTYIVGTYAGEKGNLWAFSVDYLKKYTDDLDGLRGKKRIWILFSDTPILRKGIDEEVFFIYYLNTFGEQKDVFRSEGSRVYLYDLSEEATPTFKSHEGDVKKNLHWYF